MCTTPKPPKAQKVDEKDPQYMRNAWLDSMSMTRSQTIGRNALRIDGSRAPRGTVTTPTLPPPTFPPMAPPPDGGGGGGGRGGDYGNGTRDRYGNWRQPPPPRRIQ